MLVPAELAEGHRLARRLPELLRDHALQPQPAVRDGRERSAPMPSPRRTSAAAPGGAGASDARWRCLAAAAGCCSPPAVPRRAAAAGAGALHATATAGQTSMPSPTRCRARNRAAARGNPVSYEVFGKRYYVLASAEGYKERGVASWYGPDFHAKATSSGEPYDMYAMTAAHKTLPIPAYARVTNLSQRPQRGGAHQRSRAVRRQPHHRPVVHGRRKARHDARRHRLRGGGDHHAGRHRRRSHATLAPPPAADADGAAAVSCRPARSASQDNATQMAARLRAAGIDDVAIRPPDAGTQRCTACASVRSPM